MQTLLQFLVAILAVLSCRTIDIAECQSLRKVRNLFSLSALLLLPIALLIGACATTEDPQSGGFLDGLSGLTSGEYDQRIAREEQRIAREKQHLASEEQQLSEKGQRIV